MSRVLGLARRVRWPARLPNHARALTQVVSYRQVPSLAGAEDDLVAEGRYEDLSRRSRLENLYREIIEVLKGYPSTNSFRIENEKIAVYHLNALMTTASKEEFEAVAEKFGFFDLEDAEVKAQDQLQLSKDMLQWMKDDTEPLPCAIFGRMSEKDLDAAGARFAARQALDRAHKVVSSLPINKPDFSLERAIFEALAPQLGPEVNTGVDKWLATAESDRSAFDSWVASKNDALANGPRATTISQDPEDGWLQFVNDDGLKARLASFFAPEVGRYREENVKVLSGFVDQLNSEFSLWVPRTEHAGASNPLSRLASDLEAGNATEVVEAFEAELAALEQWWCNLDDDDISHVGLAHLVKGKDVAPRSTLVPRSSSEVGAIQPLSSALSDALEDRDVDYDDIDMARQQRALDNYLSDRPDMVEVVVSNWLNAQDDAAASAFAARLGALRDDDTVAAEAVSVVEQLIDADANEEIKTGRDARKAATSALVKQRWLTLLVESNVAAVFDAPEPEGMADVHEVASIPEQRSEYIRNYENLRQLKAIDARQHREITAEPIRWSMLLSDRHEAAEEYLKRHLPVLEALALPDEELEPALSQILIRSAIQNAVRFKAQVKPFLPEEETAKWSTTSAFVDSLVAKLDDDNAQRVSDFLADTQKHRRRSDAWLSPPA
mmetsp:Transcript_42641/g.92690  ORF Transcript_42641/g.92690 Transcript_42641/m.92690 type:complete len:666 (-) Transcript_42641:31-2028(-)